MWFVTVMQTLKIESENSVSKFPSLLIHWRFWKYVRLIHGYKLVAVKPCKKLVYVWWNQLSSSSETVPCISVEDMWIHTYGERIEAFINSMKNIFFCNGLGWQPDLSLLFLIAPIGHQLESHTRHIYGYF